MVKSRQTATDSGAVEAPFYIAATNLPARPHRTLKHNDTFGIFDSHGDIGATSGGSDGLFNRDTRYLSRFEMLINDEQPLLLGSAIRDDNLNYYVDLTNADIYVGDKLILLKDTVHIARTVYLLEDSMRQRIAIENHGAGPVDLRLSLSFSSDFADMFEVRGMHRPQRGRISKQVVASDAAVLSYQGLDDKVRQARLTFSPKPSQLLESKATYNIRLESNAKCSIFVAVDCGGLGKPKSSASFLHGMAGVHRERNRQTQGIATVETSNRVVNEVLCRAMADLYMLVTDTPQGAYPYAGIPWYSTTFGRDGIITALQMLWVDPRIAAGVLRRLAFLQAQTNDPLTDANPGKILHEMRGGEMAALKEVPFEQYYGSVDTTPLFIILAGAYASRTGDNDLVRELWPAIDKALAWIDGPGDPDRDGFVEYQRGAATGLANQGWKDSFDSVFHANGDLAEGPIALVEVQGYVYAARRAAARCARILGMEDRAAALENQAKQFRALFEAKFWCPEIGTYALALDGSKAQCKVRSSNAAQVLFTGIASAERAKTISDALFGSSFFTGWGIRTIADTETRYNPMSYHNGSIWPHDNALIALGLARYGEKIGINRLFESLMRVAVYMDHRRLPELFCGFRRRKQRGPTLYPAACSPQAWASGAPFLMLQSMLGLNFNPASRSISLINPYVPEFVGDIVIRNLGFDGETADFRVRHDRGALSLEVIRASPTMQISLVFDTAPQL